MPKKINKNVAILGFVSFLNDASSEMIVRVLPLFLESIGAGGAFIGVIEGIAGSTASLLKIFFGYFSDKFKNRKFFAFLGYAESTLAKCFLPFVHTPISVLWVRSLERVGKGIRTAPRDALISSYTTKENRGLYFGFHRALDTFGAVAGPLLGMWVLHKFGATQYATLFKFALVPAILAVILVLFVKEKKFREEIKKERQKSKFKLGRKFYYYIFVVTMFTIGNSSDAFITMYAGTLGMLSITILLLWAIHNITYGLLSVPFGALSDKIGRKPTIIIGYAIYGISYLGFALTKSASFLYFLFPLYGVYYAFAEGAQKAFVSDLVEREDARGTAYGIYNFGVGIMAFPASLIAGILYQYVSPRMPFYFGGLMATVSTILMLFV